MFEIDINEESARDNDDEGQAESDQSGSSASGEVEELLVEIESFQDDFPRFKLASLIL